MTAVALRKMIGNALFFLRNMIMARKLDDIEHHESLGLVFRGYSEVDADSISRIYTGLNDGAAFSTMQRSLYGRIGKRCLFVAELVDEAGAPKIVGMNMYYFNERDIKEHTIHEGFIGVDAEFNGRGIATKMRQMAIQHFKLAGFSGISTRISLDNFGSLKSAQKLGFLPCEEYRDAVTGEKRYYMICKF